MKIKLANGLPFHDHLRHPKTGQLLRAIMIGKNGKPVWPVMGASEDDDADKGDKPDADPDADADADDKGKKPEETAEAKELREAQEELAKVKKRLSAADKNKAAAEKKLKELENKDKPEDEKAKAELEEAKTAAQKAGESMRKLAITNAFLTSSQKAKITWYDPELAASQCAQSDGIEIDEDGTVTGMDAAAKKLAKDKPFLVDSGSKKEEDDEDKKNGPSGSGVGSGTGKGKGKGTGQPDAEALRKKYPSLRN